jgi:hypothetical protein
VAFLQNLRDSSYAPPPAESESNNTDYGPSLYSGTEKRNPGWRLALGSIFGQGEERRRLRIYQQRWKNVPRGSEDGVVWIFLEKGKREFGRKLFGDFLFQIGKFCINCI